jgi:hypothetical protein
MEANVIRNEVVATAEIAFLDLIFWNAGKDLVGSIFQEVIFREKG